MADVSIEKLASDIGTPVDRLVGQFKDAGITKNAGDQVNEDEKKKLLDSIFLVIRWKNTKMIYKNLQILI